MLKTITEFFSNIEPYVNMQIMIPYIFSALGFMIVFDACFLKPGSKGLSWSGESLRIVLTTIVIYLIHNRANMGEAFDISLLTLSIILYIDIIVVAFFIKNIENIK